MVKNMTRTIILTLFIYICTCITAQNANPQNLLSDSIQTDWQNLFVQLSSTDELESDSWQEAFDVLSELEQHPININTATREELEAIPFLNDQQIEDIQAYIYQYGGMQTLSELAMIESLDRPHILLLHYFTYAAIDEKKSFPSLKNITQYGQHQLTLDGNIPFYRRSGDNNGYLGYPYRHTLRYDFHYSDFIKIGLLGAQDAGEPFFANNNRYGYDHYSFYAVIRKMGRIKSLALGRYKLRTGMGLVLNNDFGFGKTMMLSSLSRNGSIIRAYTSRSSAKYLQGAATTIELTKNIDLTAFYSYRKIDATLNKSNGSITTIRTDGYHRTELEMEKKHNASQQVYGGNIGWTHKRFHTGITALTTYFDRQLSPNTSQKYRYYYPTGNHFWNASIDYCYRSRKLTVSGETATGDTHAVATVNMVTLQPNSQLMLTALYRFYSYRFTSLLGESFAEGGQVQNEQGAYLGINWKPFRQIQVIAYTDYAYFPWMKYQISNSSHSWDNYIAVTYNHLPFTIGGSYRLKTRLKDNAQKTSLIDDRTHRARLFLSWQKKQFSLKTQGDYAVNNYKTVSRGWMVSQFATCQIPVHLQLSGRQWSPLLQTSAQIAYFHTDDYQSRLYAYERGLLYSFSFPASYGEGIRYSLHVRAALSTSLLVVAKIGTTDYFDRDHISSGRQQINSSSKTDLELQVRWKF